jgi:hypothetical protein
MISDLINKKNYQLLKLKQQRNNNSLEELNNNNNNNSQIDSQGSSIDSSSSSSSSSSSPVNCDLKLNATTSTSNKLEIPFYTSVEQKRIMDAADTLMSLSHSASTTPTVESKQFVTSKENNNYESLSKKLEIIKNEEKEIVTHELTLETAKKLLENVFKSNPNGKLSSITIKTMSSLSPSPSPALSSSSSSSSSSTSSSSSSSSGSSTYQSKLIQRKLLSSTCPVSSNFNNNAQLYNIKKESPELNNINNMKRKLTQSPSLSSLDNSFTFLKDKYYSNQNE